MFDFLKNLFNKKTQNSDIAYNDYVCNTSSPCEPVSCGCNASTSEVATDSADSCVSDDSGDCSCDCCGCGDD